MKQLIVIAAALRFSAAFCETVFLTAPADGTKTATRIEPTGTQSVFRVDVPARDIQLMWMPSWKVPRQGRKWWLASESAPQAGMPYVAYFNCVGRNAFSIGVSALRTDVRIGSKINQEKGVWEVTVTLAAQPGHLVEPFTVTLDRRGKDWTDILADWRASLGYERSAYPAAAWEPVFCSWYARHADITQDWVERAAAAADMGFKTFILDDGWSYDERKRVSPQTIGTWYQDIGRWDRFSTEKFPDFRAHRERMRALGLNYLVWTAPYFVGTRSPAYRRFGFDKRGDKPFEGNVLADPDDRRYLDSVDEQLVTLLRDFDLDGLKIDFLDYIPPSVEKPRAHASLTYITQLMAKLRSVKPNGLFEFRQNYATPLTASLATQFRAGDVPFEWLPNLLRIAQIRLTMGDRVPIHSDPIFWSTHETDDNINRHFLSSMAGVPMLSIDLTTLPPRHRATAKKWIRFYADHVKPFQKNGRWRVQYRGGNLRYLTSHTGRDILAIVNDPDAAAELAPLICAKNALLLNLTYSPLAFGEKRHVPPAAAALLPADPDRASVTF